MMLPEPVSAVWRAPSVAQFRIGKYDLVEDYLDNVYNTIVLRDIIERENIRNIPLLRERC